MAINMVTTVKIVQEENFFNILLLNIIGSVNVFVHNLLLGKNFSFLHSFLKNFFMKTDVEFNQMYFLYLLRQSYNLLRLFFFTFTRQIIVTSKCDHKLRILFTHLLISFTRISVLNFYVCNIFRRSICILPFL